MERKPKFQQRASLENIYDAIDFVRTAELDRMNRDLQQRIQAEVHKGRSPSIGFVVNDGTKWNGDSLLDEMRNAGWSTNFYLCPKQASYSDREDRRAAYRVEREFFMEVDQGLVDLYDQDVDQVKPVEDVIKDDVLFYQQPWGMNDFPRRLAGRVLNAYMHYGFVLMANHGMHYNVGSFYAYLWRYFTQTEQHRLLHLEHDPAAYDRLVVTGYPKLDCYLSDPTIPGDQLWPATQTKAARIIYAPHHSVGKGSLGMATFPWAYEFMLELAKKTPNTQWAYKPHPNLKYTVARNNIMTREEYQQYEAAWAQLPNAVVFDSGRYFDLFRSSDSLITDCGSFLAEYLPTGKPIIWLESPTSVGFNVVGESLARAFYSAASTAELEAVFRRVVLDGRDPLEGERSSAVTRLFPTEQKAATAVVDHLRQQLGVRA